MESILRLAKEELEQKYDLEARGYNFGRVAEVISMEIEKLMAYGKAPQTVKALALLCFWSHRKFGMTTIEIEKKLHLNRSAVSRSSIRGEAIARENRFELTVRNA